MGKHLSGKQWEKMKIEYCTTNCSYTDIANKYNVGLATVKTHADNENWQEFAEKILNKTKEKETEIIDKIAEKRLKVNERHIELSDTLLDLLDEIAKAKGFADDKYASTKLKALADTLQTCQKTQRTALNMDEIKIDNTEPEISIIKGIDLDRI